MEQKYSTAKTILDPVRIELSDPNGDTFGSDELLSYLNRAVRGFLRQVARLWPQYQISTELMSISEQNLEEDQTEYDLPKNLFEILDVLEDDDAVDPVAVPNVDDDDGYYLKNGKLILTSAPDERTVNGLEIYYFSRPDTIETEADPVPAVEDMGDAYIEWVTMKAKNRNDENFQGTLMMAKYMQRLLRGHAASVNKPADLALPVKEIQEKRWI